MTTFAEQCDIIWQEALAISGGSLREALTLRDRAYEVARTTRLNLAEAWQQVQAEELERAPRGSTISKGD